MSINAISSVSLYEYYYQINKDEQEKKKSPLEKQMREYGLIPTDDEQLNAILLKRAMDAKSAQKTDEKETTSYSDRPWADIMYQLDIQFNADPKDDIDDIKEELAKLLDGMDDEELNSEINGLVSYVERLYVDFININTPSFYSTTLSTQLDNLSVMNMASLL